MGYPREDHDHEGHDREESSGALGDMIVGIALAGWGGYMVCDRLIISSGYHINFFGYHQTSSFAPVFALFLLGVFLLALGRTFLAKVFMVVGAMLTAWGVMSSLEIHFAPAPMVQTFIMFSLLVGGSGLLVKSMMTSRD